MTYARPDGRFRENESVSDFETAEIRFSLVWMCSVVASRLRNRSPCLFLPFARETLRGGKPGVSNIYTAMGKIEYLCAVVGKLNFCRSEENSY